MYTAIQSNQSINEFVDYSASFTRTLSEAQQLAIIHSKKKRCVAHANSTFTAAAPNRL